MAEWFARRRPKIDFPIGTISAIFDQVILLLHCVSTQIAQRCGGEVKNWFQRLWRPFWISNRHDFSFYFHQHVNLRNRKFQLNSPCRWEMSKTDFQDCGCGGDLGFQIDMILAHLIQKSYTSNTEQVSAQIDVEN